MLQPHTSAFLKMSNHQAVMETELRHYSAITRGKLSPSLSLLTTLSQHLSVTPGCPSRPSGTLVMTPVLPCRFWLCCPPQPFGEGHVMFLDGALAPLVPFLRTAAPHTAPPKSTILFRSLRAAHAMVPPLLALLV